MVLYQESTTAVMLALRIVMERNREGHYELHCVFEDVEKAYDQVLREKK